MPHIYALVDPRDGAVRYVGKANDPALRLRGHCHEARKGKSDRKNRLIALLLRHELKPILRIIETCGDEEWKDRERFWIAHYLSVGCDLVNSKGGGDGVDYTPEVREKISAKARARTGWHHSPETRARMRAAQLGRRKAGGRARGYRMDDSTRRKIGDKTRGNRSRTGDTGWHHTAAAKAKISAARRERSL